MRHYAAVPLLAGLGACAAAPVELPLRDVAHSPQCNASVGTQQLEVLPGPGAVRAWQAARGIRLVADEDLRDASYAVLQMGRRPTAGYGITVSPVAQLRDGTLVITADFTGPAPDAMVAQVLTSPCALVELPAADYERIEARGSGGEILEAGTIRPAVPAQ